MEGRIAEMEALRAENATLAASAAASHDQVGTVGWGGAFMCVCVIVCEVGKVEMWVVGKDVHGFHEMPPTINVVFGWDGGLLYQSRRQHSLSSPLPRSSADGSSTRWRACSAR